MAYSEAMTRAYVENRFPCATSAEHEKLVQDWLTKPKQSEGIANDFEKRVGPLKGLRVLDAGSGNGGVGIAFAKRGAIVEGVDIEEELVAIAEAEVAASGSTAHFAYYEGKTMLFPDETFDAVVSVSVLEHVDDPLRYLSEILRVLKRGGIFYLAFPNRLNPKETHTGLWGLSYLPLPLARLYIRLTKHSPLEDNGLHFYTYWDIRRMLTRARAGNRSWSLKEEKGSSVRPVVRVTKVALRSLGIPHQALLPHVMLILIAS